MESFHRVLTIVQWPQSEVTGMCKHTGGKVIGHRQFHKGTLIDEVTHVITIASVSSSL